MQVLLQTALDEGACGMSTGLIYPPCCYADAAELAALGKVLAAAGRPLVVHMRSESDRMLEAVAEMAGVARDSGCAVHISHLKIAGRRNWGSAEAVVRAIEAARAEGLRITADQYPYAAGSTLLVALLPPWTTPRHPPSPRASPRRVSRARMRAAMSDPVPPTGTFLVLELAE